MFLCDRSPRLTPRVYRFYYPVRQHSFQICLIFTLVMSGMTFTLGIRERLYGFVPLTMSGIFLVVSVILVMLVFHTRNQTPQGRFHRLSRLLSHPQAMNRYPHRSVECLYRRIFTPTSRKLPRLLKTLPKGTNILTSGTKRVTITLPIPSDVFFEPADVREATECMDIIRLGYNKMMQGTDTNEEHTQNMKGRRAPISFWMRRIGGTIMSVIGIAWLVGNMVLGLYKKDHAYTIICIIWSVAILGQYWLQIFYANQWWLIPGGIIGREYRLWKKRLNIRIIRASQAASFYDMYQQKMYITHAGRVITLSLQLIQYLAFLVGWFSTARTPSEEEIRSFLDAR